MNDDQLDDLKQFIDSKISQSEARLENKLDGVESRLDGVESRLDGVESRLGNVESTLTSLEQKVDDGFAAIGDAVESLHSQQDDLQLRVTKLEQAA